MLHILKWVLCSSYTAAIEFLLSVKSWRRQRFANTTSFFKNSEEGLETQFSISWVVLHPLFDYNLEKVLHSRLIKIKSQKTKTKKQKKKKKSKLTKTKTKDFMVIGYMQPFWFTFFENCRCELAMNINPMWNEDETSISDSLCHMELICDIINLITWLCLRTVSGP